MSRRKTILFVSYPLLPVSEESAGGAEQMLCALEREMAWRGHRTLVAAAEGSRVGGELVATGAPVTLPDALGERIDEQNRRVLEFVQHHDVDLIHDQGGTFWPCATHAGIEILATLHLPRHFYLADSFAATATNLSFNCVSQSQAGQFDDLPGLRGVVRNGIALERFPFSAAKGDYLVWLGRICEEKGPHVAVDLARATGLPIVIAGQVYPFSYHRQFFEREVKPRLAALGPQAKWVPSPTAAQKVQILRNARAVLVPSLVEETSSLVAMEAMACGTPVAAFRRGALPEVVAHGETGWLADSFEEMIAAVERAREIKPRACRQHVEQHHSCSRMAAEYERLYDDILASETAAREPAA